MPLFRKKECVCGFDTVGAEIEPNPVGEYFCPRCGRELIPVKPKGATTEPGTELGTETAPETETEPAEEPPEEPPAEPEAGAETGAESRRRK